MKVTYQLLVHCCRYSVIWKWSCAVGCLACTYWIGLHKLIPALRIFILIMYHLLPTTIHCWKRLKSIGILM